MRRYTVASFVIAAAILAVVSGCSDSATKPSAEEDFPNEVGTRWVYAVYDSLAGEADTVDVRVVDEVTIDVRGETWPVTRWHLTSPKRDEYWYAFSDGDTARVWSGTETGATHVDFVYAFPFRVGNEWRMTESGWGRVSVEEIRLQVIPGFGEPVAYKLHFVGLIPNDTIIQDRWFAPGIGLVEAHLYEWFFGPFQDETWSLIAYEPPDQAQ